MRNDPVLLFCHVRTMILTVVIISGRGWEGPADPLGVNIYLGRKFPMISELC